MTKYQCSKVVTLLLFILILFIIAELSIRLYYSGMKLHKFGEDNPVGIGDGDHDQENLTMPNLPVPPNTSTESKNNTYILRKTLLKEQCKKFGLANRLENNRVSNEELFGFNIVHVRQFNFTYCQNGKTGSTTWMRHLQRLSRFPPDLIAQWEDNKRWRNVLDSLYHLHPTLLPIEDKLSLIHTTFSFTFVRHPFDRLVSTYKDKIIDSNWRNWRETIYAFVKTSKGQRKKCLPSFQEFVRTFLAGQLEADKDRHLRPYWSNCIVCDIDYQVIGKMETFTEDLGYIFQKTGLDQLLPASDLEYQTHVSSGSKSTLEYFRTLTSDQVRGIYEFYKMDFLLFGYKYEPYAEMAMINKK